MYSCTSFGTKVGGGIGVALSGWLLELSGYIKGGVATQPASTIQMLGIMYLWLPLIFNFLVLLILARLDVEKTVEKMKAEKAATI